MMIVANAKRTEDEIFDEAYRTYRSIHGDGPIRLRDVADYTLQNELWKPDPRLVQNELRRKFSRWAKSRKYRDPDGKTVRAMHAAKYPIMRSGQLTFETLWDHHRDMSLEHAKNSFSQREEQIIGAHRRLQTDVGSFNKFNPNAEGHPIQLMLPFELMEPLEPQRVEYIIPSNTVQEFRNKPR